VKKTTSFDSPSKSKTKKGISFEVGLVLYLSYLNKAPAPISKMTNIVLTEKAEPLIPEPVEMEFPKEEGQLEEEEPYRVLSQVLFSFLFLSFFIFFEILLT